MIHYKKNIWPKKKIPTNRAYFLYAVLKKRMSYYVMTMSIRPSGFSTLFFNTLYRIIRASHFFTFLSYGLVHLDRGAFGVKNQPKKVFRINFDRIIVANRVKISRPQLLNEKINLLRLLWLIAHLKGLEE